MDLSYYLVRVQENDETIRAARLGELEHLLQERGAQIKYVAAPIAAVMVYLEDSEFAQELELRGYEVALQEKNFRAMHGS
ncbi:hypothetical protein HYX10_05085 [Candidatus Woesearchaeota archaeon]|nr:hypothetical protein [Candidatus Woesearchaeota archaeon]